MSNVLPLTFDANSVTIREANGQWEFTIDVPALDTEIVVYAHPDPTYNYLHREGVLDLEGNEPTVTDEFVDNQYNPYDNE